MLRVLSPGLFATVQDLGRPGYERFGVPRSGALDWFALRAANGLVGNAPGAACLEFALQAPVLQAAGDCLVAAAGQGFKMQVQGRGVGLWRAAYVRRGEVIQLIPTNTPGWGYLAIAGGIDVPPVMGSRSTYLPGGFGGLAGRALAEGDELPVEKPVAGWFALAGRSLPPEMRPAYGSLEIPVILGPQDGFFSPAMLDTFLGEEYAVSPTSDRMGYRLSGPPILGRKRVELISEGIAPGSIQVPPDGQPIVLLSDRPTTGGYPKIATVTLAGLPLLAQSMPGSGRVRFRSVDLETARAGYQRLLKWIEEGIEGDED